MLGQLAFDFAALGKAFVNATQFRRNLLQQTAFVVVVEDAVGPELQQEGQAQPSVTGIENGGTCQHGDGKKTKSKANQSQNIAKMSVQVERCLGRMVVTMTQLLTSTTKQTVGSLCTNP